MSPARPPRRAPATPPPGTPAPDAPPPVAPSPATHVPPAPPPGTVPLRGAGTARAHLLRCGPELSALVRRVGPCGLRVWREREPFEALVRAVAHQQLHGRAAEAMLGRLLALHAGAFPTPHQLLATDAPALRGCGFSGGKVASLHDIAAAAAGGALPTRRAAARLPDEALVERLLPLRGVGRWTVEMLLIFTLGRPDVLPVDDFGVREGFRRIHGLERQPRPAELARLGEAWAPWRSVAAWYLWRAADEGKAIAPPTP